MTDKKLVRLVGDIHGNFNEYSFYTLGVGRTRHMGDVAPPDYSVQVGDFGIGFYTPYWHESVNDWMKVHTGHRFVRGNHDDPAMCKTMAGYIADGTVEGDVMFVGGAYSIDKDWRTPGIDWWPDEELSYEELDKMFDKYVETKPRVMITHDCPTHVSYEMFISKGLGMENVPVIQTRTAQAFQAMWEEHKPEEWYFGHWHNTRTMTLDGTKFQCLGQLDFIDVEL